MKEKNLLSSLPATKQPPFILMNQLNNLWRLGYQHIKIKDEICFYKHGFVNCLISDEKMPPTQTDWYPIQHLYQALKQTHKKDN